MITFSSFVDWVSTYIPDYIIEEILVLGRRGNDFLLQWKNDTTWGELIIITPPTQLTKPSRAILRASPANCDIPTYNRGVTIETLNDIPKELLEKMYSMIRV